MNPPAPAQDPQFTRFDAAVIADARGVLFAPASLLVQARPLGPAIVAVGGADAVDAAARGLGVGAGSAAVRSVSLPRSILLPGLVNAHTHLDLTHIGPRPHDPQQGFIPWIDLIRAHRHSDDESIAAAVRQGIALSLAGGVVAVGDIAGAPKATPNLTPWRTLRESPLLGVSFLEFFGLGKSWASQPERLTRILAQADQERTSNSIRLGLQPHAPVSVDLRLYRWIVEHTAARGLPLSTHLAETPEEHEFIATASGPQREFLKRIGLWDDNILDHLGRGRHPVAHLGPVLNAAMFLVAHVNDADDDAIRTLARTGASVAYCPRASDYFAAHRHFGPHCYRNMLSAGVNVCLGTDSIVNLPAGAADPRQGGISTLDEMRFLYRRDSADPATLLAMATTHGARALGLDESRFRFDPGSILAGLNAVELDSSIPDPLTAALKSGSAPQLLLNARGHTTLGSS